MLSDEEIAAVVFNETRSYSGQGLARARADMAHAIVNGDERLGTLRPVAAATTAKVPPSERSAYNECLEAVRQARAERSLGYDSTNGASHFNQRGNAHLGNFQRGRFQTQSGPFTNSFPTKGPNGLPATGVYILTYE